MKIQSALTLLFTLGLLSSCRPPSSFDDESVKTAIDRFDAAWRTQSAPALDSVLSPAYLYFTQSGGLFQRDEMLNTARSGEYRLDQSKREILSWKADGNTVTVNTIWTGQGVYRGRAFADTQRCSLTLVRKGNDVRILSEHCTVITRREKNPGN